MSNKLKTPPYSDEAEKSVLGCMILSKECAVTAINLLKEDDFYIDQNRWIFSAINNMSVLGLAIDCITVIDKLNDDNLIAKIGATYITDLTEIVPSTNNIEQYCKIVSEKATLREMIINFGNLISDCYESNVPLLEIIEKAERFIYNMSVNKTKSEFIPLKDAITPAVVKIAELYQKNNHMTGVSSGFKALDAITSGFQPSDFILLAARPSMGKTSLGLNFAQNAAFRGKKIVAFFSLEMSCQQLVMRIISSEAEVDSKKIRVGSQTNAEWTKIAILNSTVADNDVQLYIDDTSSISVGEVRSKLRKLKAQVGLDMVVIDYLQLMTTNSRNENRQQEISTISRELKAIAKELYCPVIALSQLSRSPESRDDKRPILSDLRESGAIEQDADVVMMLYREKYYDNKCEHDNTEVIIAKHRNGETGTTMLSFLGEYTKFKDVEQQSATVDII